MKEITSNDFDADVLKSPGVVLVDISADHCPLCRLLTPILEELAGDLEGRAKFLKMNVEKNMDLAGRLGVVALPTVLVFNGGKIRVRMVGLQNKKRLLEAIEMAEGNGT